MRGSTPIFDDFIKKKFYLLSALRGYGLGRRVPARDLWGVDWVW